jgi:hypothetical protein
MAPFNLRAEAEVVEAEVVVDAEAARAEASRETILGAAFGNKAIEVVRVSLNRMRIEATNAVDYSALLINYGHRNT